MGTIVSSCKPMMLRYNVSETEYLMIRHMIEQPSMTHLPPTMTQHVHFQQKRMKLIGSQCMREEEDDDMSEEEDDD